MAKAVAQLRGRDYVTPKDVQEVFLRTIAHRLLLTPKTEAAGITAYQVLGEILHRVPAPKTI
jgi:MoxR-like ATPase